MSAKPKLLLVSHADHEGVDLAHLAEQYEFVRVSSSLRALGRLAREEFAGVFVAGGELHEALSVGGLLQNDRILQGMPDGVVLLDSENVILWSNACFQNWCRRAAAATGEATEPRSAVGQGFYVALGSPEILGPDFCPFHTALACASASSSTLHTSDNHHLRVHAAPILEADGPPRNLVVTIRDITSEVLQQQKLAAIHQAGIQLADLTPTELSRMSVDERKELLKQNILHYTQHLLNFSVVEIRLLDQKTGRLVPLLYEGISDEAAQRELFALRDGNGVTGYVAATGKSYLCEDTAEDPLFLEGAKGAKSCLTVPLMLHDEVIGTFNVESREPCAFNENDLQFLEIFGRDVAASLNTLELLVAEKASTAFQSVEAIHSEVALPIDRILADAVNIIDSYIGHDPEVTERLQRILRNARDIRQVIQKVGQKMAPVEALPESLIQNNRPLLRGLRILVVDTDETVRLQSHALLERYGCTVEGVSEGGDAYSLVANVVPGEPGYDVIITDIRLVDMTGFELLQRLATVLDYVPIIFMAGFGWDPGHSIPKARQHGYNLVTLAKPFRLDQLLGGVEQVIRAPRPIKQG